MIIIVEGIDRVGKTTLCKKLSKKFNIQIFKNEKFLGKYIGADTEIELINEIINFVKTLNVNVIFDRLHLSEYVYGKMERDYENETVFDLENKMIKSFDDLFLILVVPTNIDKSSLEHGKDLKPYNKEFISVFEKSNIKNKFICNYNELDAIVERISEVQNGNQKIGNEQV